MFRSRAGPERSRTSASVIAETKQLADAGYSEIQLLGQNVNSYRDPSPAGWDFATLLDQVGRVPGMRRVRFTTSHPRDFVKPIIDAIDDNPNLCNHVHLPVQSGSTRVLSAMQRLYTREEYLRRIEWIKNAAGRSRSRRILLSAFRARRKRSLRRRWTCFKQVEFDALFGFKYSRRPNTPALALEDQIPEEEKTRRLQIVLDLQREIQLRRHAAYVGTVEECLVEGFNKATLQWIGRTSQHKTLNFLRPASAEDILGKYVDVRVTRAGANSLVGECVN